MRYLWNAIMVSILAVPVAIWWGYGHGIDIWTADFRTAWGLIK